MGCKSTTNFRRGYSMTLYSLDKLTGQFGQTHIESDGWTRTQHTPKSVFVCPIYSICEQFKLWTKVKMKKKKVGG